MDINSCLLPIPDATLALYAHLIPALATMILGVFALFRAQNKAKANVFFAFTATFALWLLLNLVNWISHDHALIAASWAPLDFLNIVFFLLLGSFIAIDLADDSVVRRYNIFVLVAVTIPFLITITGNAVYEMDLANCEMIGNEFLAQYKLGIEILVLLGALAIAFWRFVFTPLGRQEKQRIALVVGSVFLFLGVFSGAERYSTLTGDYETALYSLFTLPVFILSLTIAITSYNTMRLGNASVKALFYVFLVLAGTQFFFVADMRDFLLALMSFIVVLTLGISLYSTSEREIRQRHVIELQADQLENINKQQEGLLRFISHEVKGYLTKGQAAFSGIAQGDYGAITPELQRMSENAVIDARKGVDMVADILDASNLRKGTVSYAKASFDFKKSVEQVVHDLTPSAEAKGIALAFSSASGSYILEGDEAKLRRHVVRNLIDNSIHYTPKGEIRVALSRSDNHLRFSVKDTGVGITKEDMQRLFTEGGHGKESTKVNIDSTGYGLFIAKQITEVHGGTIQAFSKGEGQGSEFVVELPL